MFEGVCEPTVAAVQAADPFALAAALAGVSQDQLAGCTQDEAECVVAATQRIVNAATARQAWRSPGTPSTCWTRGTPSGRPGTRAVAVTRYTEHVLDARDASGWPGRGGEGMPVGQPSPVQQAAAGLAPVLRLAPRTMVTRIQHRADFQRAAA